MLTRAEIKVLEKLIAQEGIKGKKALRRFIWLNTTEPKFKVGQCFRIDDPSRSIFGHRAINFKGKVIDSFTMVYDQTYYYHLDAECTCGDRHYTARFSVAEYDLKELADDNINILDAPKSEHPDAIEL